MLFLKLNLFTFLSLKFPKVLSVNKKCCQVVLVYFCVQLVIPLRVGTWQSGSVCRTLQVDLPFAGTLVTRTAQSTGYVASNLRCTTKDVALLSPCLAAIHKARLPLLLMSLRDTSCPKFRCSKANCLFQTSFIYVLNLRGPAWINHLFVHPKNFRKCVNLMQI